MLWGLQRTSRLVAIHELARDHLDVDIMKKVCDGCIQLIRLYKNATLMKTCFKLYITTNNDLNFRTDSGIEDRSPL